MTQHPRLKRHLSVIRHSVDVVELRDGVWNPTSVTLTDEEETGTLGRIIELVDGEHSVGEISRAARASRGQVNAVLDRLREMQLVEGESGNALDHFVQRSVPTLLPFGGTPDADGRAPLVVGHGDVTTQLVALLDRALGAGTAELHGPDAPLGGALHHAADVAHLDGFAFEEWSSAFDDWRGRYLVWISDTVRPDQLRALNRLALHLGITWTHACVDGPFLLVGPTFVPRRTACYECLDTRLLMNLREAASYQRYKQALAEGKVSGQTAPLDTTLEAMLAAHTSFEALNMLTTGGTFSRGRMLAIYLPTLEFAFNEVLRVPGCPACGPAAESDDHELYFDIRSMLNGRVN